MISEITRPVRLDDGPRGSKPGGKPDTKFTLVEVFAGKPKLIVATFVEDLLAAQNPT